MHYDERYQQILGAGARIFAKKGFHHASMRDMSRETKMSLAGLYYYFQSKEELLFLIQKDIFETILEAITARLEATQDPEEQLRALFEVHAGYCIREMDRVRVLSHESDSLEGEFWEQIRDLKRKYYRLVRSVLDTLSRRGRLVQPDPHVAAMAYFGMVNWIYTWYRPGGALDEVAISKELSDIFCRGVLKG